MEKMEEQEMPKTTLGDIATIGGQSKSQKNIMALKDVLDGKGKFKGRESNEGKSCSIQRGHEFW